MANVTVADALLSAFRLAWLFAARTIVLKRPVDVVGCHAPPLACSKNVRQLTDLRECLHRKRIHALPCAYAASPRGAPRERA